ncbi:MAG: flavoprotein [Gemmatimonadetes bacterium]|nr:flavoprotein [Gemmatimonadota bacterium]|tara:strand:+ start:2689 stop:3273 length:585 start_codon:yes stop_codon:yes gene_type:complete
MSDVNVSVFSCSLHSQSRSYVMAQKAVEDLVGAGAQATLYDLREYDLDFCGRPEAREYDRLGELRSAVRDASAVLMAVPIYNFYVNAAAKNLIELTGREWIYKLVGFICAAGGQASYMSVMNIANSLMLDFRCIIVPRFVYATSGAFGNDREPDMYVQDESIVERINELATMTVSLAKALDPVIEEMPERKGRT